MASTEAEREVLVAESFQLRVASLFRCGLQVLHRKCRGQAVQQRSVTLVDARIEMADVQREVGRRHAVLVVESSAAEDVEQHVGVVMRRHGLLGRGLESVRGSHDARQFFAARVDGVRHGECRSGRIREVPDDVDHLRLGSPDIGHDLPSL